jgi:predicted PurR-regulated permease PerM
MRYRIARAVLVGLSLVSLALMAVLVYPFAGALLFGAVLAGTFLPMLERLTRRLRGRRALAAGLLTAAVTVLIVLPASAFAIVLGREAIDAVSYVRDTLQAGGLPALLAKLPAPVRGVVDAFHLPSDQSGVQELAQQQNGRAAAAVGGVIVATSNALFQIAAMLVAFFFLLVDGPRLVEWVADAAPIGRSRTYELLHDFRTVSEAVLISSLATAGVQTCVALAGYLLAGVPQPVFFTLVTFIVAFIPMLGAASVSVALAGLLYLTGHPTQALVLALWAVLVGVSDNIVKPLLMRNRMEVHGAVIFFSLIGGLAAFGMAGLVAGPLIVSFFLAIVRMCRRDLYELDDKAESARTQYRPRTA